MEDARVRTELVSKLRDLVNEGDGHLDAKTRRAAYDGSSLPAPIGPFVTKVRECAYETTEGDIASLHEAGLSDDEVFELTIATALGAGMRRLDAGRRAMGRS